MNLDIVVVVFLTGRAGNNGSQGEKELSPEPFLFVLDAGLFAGLIGHGMEK